MIRQCFLKSILIIGHFFGNHRSGIEPANGFPLRLDIGHHVGRRSQQRIAAHGHLHVEHEHHVIVWDAQQIATGISMLFSSISGPLT